MQIYKKFKMIRKKLNLKEVKIEKLQQNKKIKNQKGKKDNLQKDLRKLKAKHQLLILQNHPMKIPKK